MTYPSIRLPALEELEATLEEVRVALDRTYSLLHGLGGTPGMEAYTFYFTTEQKALVRAVQATQRRLDRGRQALEALCMAAMTKQERTFPMAQVYSRPGEPALEKYKIRHDPKTSRYASMTHHATVEHAFFVRIANWSWPRWVGVATVWGKPLVVWGRTAGAENSTPDRWEPL